MHKKNWLTKLPWRPLAAVSVIIVAIVTGIIAYVMLQTTTQNTITATRYENQVIALKEQQNARKIEVLTHTIGQNQKMTLQISVDVARIRVVQEIIQEDVRDIKSALVHKEIANRE